MDEDEEEEATVPPPNFDFGFAKTFQESFDDKESFLKSFVR